MIRVAIADDSPFTCKLLAGYFEETGDCLVVGFAHDAPTTIDRHERIVAQREGIRARRMGAPMTSGL